MAARTNSGRPTGKSAQKVVIPQLPWHEIWPAPIVLISGPEDALADRANIMLREFLREKDPSLEVSDIEADSYQRGQLITLASPSLFGEPRLVRVAAVDKASDDFLLDAIEYLEHPADNATIVLRHRSGLRGKRLLEAVRAGTTTAVEIVCTELKRDQDKQDFAAALFRTEGRRIVPGALRALVSAFSSDTGELAAACYQLMADSAGEIDEALVAKYYGGQLETTVFEVADAAIAGKRGQALIMLRQALAAGSEPVPMVAAFALKVRGMAKVAGTRGSSARLAGQLGMAPWQIDRARRDLGGWTDEGLANAVEALAVTDATVKGGGRDPVYALERLVGVLARRGRN